MLTSQPGPFNVNEFLAGVARKQKRGKLKLEYSVITLLVYRTFGCFYAAALDPHGVVEKCP